MESASQLGCSSCRSDGPRFVEHVGDHVEPVGSKHSLHSSRQMDEDPRSSEGAGFGRSILMDDTANIVAFA